MSDSDALDRILNDLSSSDSVSSLDLATALKVDHQEVIVKAMKTLEAAEFLVAKKVNYETVSLTDEGAAILAEGKTPEFKFFEALTAEGVATPDLQTALGSSFKIGMGPNMKNKWAKKDGNLIKRVADPATIKDDVFIALTRVKGGETLPDADVKNLTRRKLATKKPGTYFQLAKGPNYQPEFKKQEASLTKEMLASGSWQQTPPRAVNLDSLGSAVGGGYFHPLLKVRAEFRRILMCMGFEEMPTNRWVESSFWNFDSLFQPQSHPARDAHDTFFIKSPESTLTVPEDYYERVKTMHQTGGHGSIGYRYDFKREEAFKNLLRTHTTAISSSMLYRLANDFKATGVFTPKKYFSVDRVFRNESMDQTHLCEFHQVEGLVADRNLSLKHLIGIIKTFFESIGITQLRFKPAFNPYTEPSMEVFGFHPGLGKWSEIGNSGMFRPEMLAPMGLPPDVRVIAWGLSLERPTMIKYGINNIRDLFGHKVDISRTKNAPLARFP